MFAGIEVQLAILHPMARHLSIFNCPATTCEICIMVDRS